MNTVGATAATVAWTPDLRTATHNITPGEEGPTGHLGPRD